MVIVMRSSSSGRFQRYCYVQYQDMFNTIEQTVFIEQNQCQQTKKIKYFRAISLKKPSYSSRVKIFLKTKELIYKPLKCSHES